MKPKLPRPRLHTRKLSLAGKSAYGMNLNKTPKFKPQPDDTAQAPSAAFPMNNVAFPGGGQ